MKTCVWGGGGGGGGVEIRDTRQVKGSLGLQREREIAETRLIPAGVVLCVTLAVGRTDAITELLF